MDQQPTSEQQQTPAAPASVPKKSKAPVIVGVVGGLAVLGVIGAVVANRSNTANGTSNSNASGSQGNYKDGTYSADGSYQTHAGGEMIHITITLKGNVITDSQFVGTSTSPISQSKMNDFAANYKTMVVGQNIDTVNLGKVSGSSLTPLGFNDALAKIKAQAKM